MRAHPDPLEFVLCSSLAAMAIAARTPIAQSEAA
jgi:hypothetical protein